MISPTLQRIFERVRDGADFMPAWQLEVKYRNIFSELFSLFLGVRLPKCNFMCSHAILESFECRTWFKMEDRAG